MKSIAETNYYNKLKGVKLFIGDLEDIIEKLKQHNLNIGIKVGLDEYNDLHEVKDKFGEKPKSLTLTSFKKPYVVTNLVYSKNCLTINSFGNKEDHNFGLLLNQFIKDRIPWHYKFFNPWVYAIILFFFSLWGILVLDNTSGETLKDTTLIICAALIVLLFISGFFRYYSYGIILAKKHEYGFWKKNKDEFILNLISTFIGAILGIIGTLLVT